MRWLQTQNKVKEMAKILAKVAKSNGKTLPSSVHEALQNNIKVYNNVPQTVIILLNTNFLIETTMKTISKSKL